VGISLGLVYGCRRLNVPRVLVHSLEIYLVYDMHLRMTDVVHWSVSRLADIDRRYINPSCDPLNILTVSTTPVYHSSQQCRPLIHPFISLNCVINILTLDRDLTR
jgi:hypothetical protein